MSGKPSVNLSAEPRLDAVGRGDRRGDVRRHLRCFFLATRLLVRLIRFSLCSGRLNVGLRLEIRHARMVDSFLLVRDFHIGSL